MGIAFPVRCCAAKKKCDGSNAIGDVCKGSGREKKVMKEYRLLEVVYQVRRGK